MTAIEFSTVLNAVPFRPFRLIVTRGASYEVRSPDGILLTATEAFLPEPADADGIRPAVRAVPLVRVTRVEML